MRRNAFGASELTRRRAGAVYFVWLNEPYHRRYSKEEIRLSDHFSALQERKGEAIGFSESERQGRSSSATLQNDALLDITVVGSSPQGEEDTRAACQVLKSGSTQMAVTGIRSFPVASRLIVSLLAAKIPIVRWRSRSCGRSCHKIYGVELNSMGSVQNVLSSADAVTELGQAIEKKARDTKIPRQLRSKLVSRLDATPVPGLAFDAVVRRVSVHTC